MSGHWDDLDLDPTAEARAIAQINPTSRAVRANGGPATIPEPVSTVERHAGSLIDWVEFWSKDRTSSDWLLEPILARGRGHAGIAPGKGQKSLLALNLCAALATGQAVLHRPAGDPVDVLYLDLEMTEDDLYDRLEEMGYGPATDLDHLHYHSLPSLSPLDTEHGGAEVVELAMHHGAELVVVDTLSRVIAGPENDADTLRNFFAYTGMPLKAAGIASWRLDHVGKDATKGGRGTSAKNDDVDVVWEITKRDAGKLDLKATHKRMGWISEQVHLELKTDPLRYILVNDTWPAGTADAARMLGDAEIPEGTSRRKARQMLIDAGLPAPRNDVIGAALRFRSMSQPGDQI